MPGIKINELNQLLELDQDTMNDVHGGLWIFGWGGTIGNKRRRARKGGYREYTSCRRRRNGRVVCSRTCDYRKISWPVVK